MIIKKKKSLALIPLVLITVLVWGVIISRIIAYYSSNNSDESEKVDYSIVDQGRMSKTYNASRQETSYKKLDRDPFSMGLQKNLEGENKQDLRQGKPEVIKTIKPQLNYNIKGVIVNNDSRLVIFDDLTNGRTLFLREGDEYSGIEIRSIEVNKVVVYENKKIREISTN